MNILEHYTGNTMINNALMTIKALSGISSISELTTTKLHQMVMRINDEIPYSLIELNLRFKSYTMLFSRNGPLHNDNKNGKQIYLRLLLKIIDNFENEGKYVCELSGLKYNRTFSDLFSEVMNDLKLPESTIRTRDLTVSRCWFPLLGGLGSDAQSLPMAKYTYNVHPIFIVILQFLPLSALLYKKGILLVDSSNIEFCESYVAENVERVKENILSTPVEQDIQNIKDFTKGNYLIQALHIMKDMEYDYHYIDINLWSFSNSGTGANCAIDRLPNSLLLKLKKIYASFRVELEAVLSNQSAIFSFIACLDASIDWPGLYPTSKYEGVSVPFFEMYWNIVGVHSKLNYAKYIAYLISLYKPKAFEKYLSKSDAYDTSKYNYKDDLNAVLIIATQQEKWSFHHQLAIQQDKQSIPVRYNYRNLFKLIHFYYTKNELSEIAPPLENENSPVSSVCKWVISLIEKDEKKESFSTAFKSVDYNDIILDELFVRHILEEDIDMNQLFPIICDEYGNYRSFGLLSLLRFYFVASNDCDFITLTEEEKVHLFKLNPPDDFKRWFVRINQFADDYINYRCAEIDNVNKGSYILKIIKGIPQQLHIKMWFDDILYNMNQFNKLNNKKIWVEEDIIYDPLGNYKFRLAMLNIRIYLYKSISMYTEKNYININF